MHIQKAYILQSQPNFQRQEICYVVEVNDVGEVVHECIKSVLNGFVTLGETMQDLVA